jgi:hypothetical protein
MGVALPVHLVGHRLTAVPGHEGHYAFRQLTGRCLLLLGLRVPIQVGAKFGRVHRRQVGEERQDFGYRDRLPAPRHRLGNVGVDGGQGDLVYGTVLGFSLSPEGLGLFIAQSKRYEHE